MGIVFQQVIAADQKYTITNSPANVTFDFHNDSPYNMGVSFGKDTGVQNADYFTTPHTLLLGVPIPGAQKYALGGVKFSGNIYLYTQTPLGAGAINYSNAPGQSITVLAYAQGETAQNVTSLNRMQSVGNNLTLSSAQIIVDTGRNTAQSTVFAQPLGDSNPAGTLNLTNDGKGTFGDSTNNGLVTVNGTIAGAQATLGQNFLRILAATGIDLINITADLVSAAANGSGVAHMYEIFRAGEYKYTIIYLINFLNSGADLDMNLPVAYAGPFSIRTTNVGLLNFMNGAAAQNCGVFTTLAAGGGTVTVQTSVNQFSFADNINPCTAVRFKGGQATTRNGLIIMEGK